MNTKMKVAVVAALVAVIGVIIAAKQGGAPEEASRVSAQPSSASETPETNKAAKLPRLVEIGSTTCIPCKMMKPILDELRQEYSGRLQVDFIDVQEDREAARKYDIRFIPTQVFLDADGKELFRHEGFFPKEEILAKWKEVGVDLNAPPEGEAPQEPQPESKGTL